MRYTHLAVGYFGLQVLITLHPLSSNSHSLYTIALRYNAGRFNVKPPIQKSKIKISKIKSLTVKESNSLAVYLRFINVIRHRPSNIHNPETGILTHLIAFTPREFLDKFTCTPG